MNHKPKGSLFPYLPYVLSCPVLSCGPIAHQPLSLLGGGDLEQPSSHLHNARAGLGKLSGT